MCSTPYYHGISQKLLPQSEGPLDILVAMLFLHICSIGNSAVLIYSAKQLYFLLAVDFTSLNFPLIHLTQSPSFIPITSQSPQEYHILPIEVLYTIQFPDCYCIRTLIHIIQHPWLITQFIFLLYGSFPLSAFVIHVLRSMPLSDTCDSWEYFFLYSLLYPFAFPFVTFFSALIICLLFSALSLTSSSIHPY